MKIVVLDGYCLNPGDLSWKDFEALGVCTVYDRTKPEEVLERAKDAEVLLTNKTVLDAATLEQLPRLRYVGVLATGYNVVDVKAAREHGVTVTNIPAYSTESVVQTVFAHILNIIYHVGHYTEQARNGVWQAKGDFCYWDSPLLELYGKRIGIVGMGNIGRAVARVARAFGMTIYTHTSATIAQLPAGTVKADLETLFRECDIVTLHCPLRADNPGMVNAALLDLMKPTAILINTARGPLVNEQDLADALRAGKLRAAGVDVLSSEPPRADNPLLTAPNCFITPHIAWATLDARERLMAQAVNNLRLFLRGTPVNVVE